jgi:hypothetical protein
MLMLPLNCLVEVVPSFSCSQGSFYSLAGVAGKLKVSVMFTFEPCDCIHLNLESTLTSCFGP